MKEWEVWSEGYRATGEQGFARFHGSYDAPTFREACVKAFDSESGRRLFSEKHLTYWGCRLFSNERDARRRFG